MELITSKSNSLIKEVGKLFASGKARRESGVFVLEGARLCFDALNSNADVKTVLITEQCFNKYENEATRLIDKSDKSFFISEEISQKLSQTENSQGVFAICGALKFNEKLDPELKYIALDCVRDPANLGAVARTAESLARWRWPPRSRTARCRSFASRRLFPLRLAG